MNVYTVIAFREGLQASLPTAVGCRRYERFAGVALGEPLSLDESQALAIQWFVALSGDP